MGALAWAEDVPAARVGLMLGARASSLARYPIRRSDPDGRALMNRRRSEIATEMGLPADA